MATFMERSRTTANLKRTAQGRPDMWLLALVGSLCLFSLVMVYSASYAALASFNLQPTAYLTRQFFYMVLGWLALLITMRIDYRWWRRFSGPGMLICLLLLAAIFVLPASVVPLINGAKRWIDLGPIGFQPSEVTKIAFSLYLAAWLSQKGDKVRNLTVGLIPFGIVLGVIVALIIKEPDMGSSLVIVSIGISVFFVAGADLKQLGAGLVLAVGTFIFLINSAGYRGKRLQGWLDPFSDFLGSGYHPAQSMIALGDGGIFGLGLGASRQKYNWLPEQYTDTIFSVIGEELGLIGAVCVIVVFVSIVYLGYRTALRAPDSFGSLLATGITTWFGFQALINIAAATNSIPFTGIPLPFISFGGTSLTVSLAAVGILLNISRHARATVAEDTLPSVAEVRTRMVQAAAVGREIVGNRPSRGGSRK